MFVFEEITKFFLNIYNQADWLNVGLGFALSLILPTVVYFFKFIKYLFQSTYQGYYGTYYLYGYFLLQAKDGKKVNSIKLEIKKNYFGKPKVCWYDGKYKYKGSLKIYDQNIYIHVTGLTHKEDQLLIFKLPLLPVQFDLLCGIKVAITSKADPAASINLLSRKMLEKSQIIDILGANKTLKLSPISNKLDGLKDPITLLPIVQ